MEWECATDRNGEFRTDSPLGAALGVAESVARLHGGEVRLRSRADGGLLVELRFPIRTAQA
jgi:signal transduction histidine kinase